MVRYHTTLFLAQEAFLPVSRRSFLAASSLACLHHAAHTLFGSPQNEGSNEEGERLTELVDLAIGTGGHGHTYPGATVPFGMVQLSPDTYNKGWDWCSGYHRGDASMMGFSHTHLSGTGIGDMLDLLVMPGTGALRLDPGSPTAPESGYRSRFSHLHEQFEPGFYSVLLDDYGVLAELTATERCGMHRYTFPPGASGHVLVDLAHAYGGDTSSVRWASMECAADGLLLGSRSTGQWAKGRQIHFAMRLSLASPSMRMYFENRPLEPSARIASGRNLKCVVALPPHRGRVLLIKVGLSPVDPASALRNLDSELPGWDFDGVRRQAGEQWEQELSRIRIRGGTRDQRTIFYTSLYHTMLAPTLFDDVDGVYRGMDGAVHRMPAERHFYSTFSLWDTFRAAHPLYTLALGDRVPDFANCLTEMCVQSADGPPVWPLQSIETACMSGYHSAVVLAEAVVKGFCGFDIARAWPALRRRAMDDLYQDIDLYRQYGYVPCDLAQESASRTLDYAYDDWAVARIAEAVGAEQDQARLLSRAGNFEQIFDARTGFMRPRRSDGSWPVPFDPREISITRRWRDYQESNGWQATFAVQHDPARLIELLGGDAAMLRKLDGLFADSRPLPPDTPPDVAGLWGMYAHGNEPSHHIAYLYNYAGAPWKTQQRARAILDRMYTTLPDGLAGNEDCGQMSAWYVMSAMGFYAVDPVSGNYVFGSPIFDHCSVRLAGGGDLVVEAVRDSTAAIYIDRIERNGKPHTRSWFSHAEVAGGAHFRIYMSERPNPSFGSATQDRPPSRSRHADAPATSGAPGSRSRAGST